MGIQFAFSTAQWPLYGLVGVAIVLGVAWVVYRLDGRRSMRLHQFVEAQLAPRLLVGYDEKVRKPLFWFTVLGVLFLLLTLAQPRWGQSWMDVNRTSRDILVLLDTSESMNADDLPPTRLDRAKQKIEALAALCPGDRFGLVAFSGSTILQCPLTLDHGYFRTLVHASTTDSVTTEGTDIEAAIRAAADVFEEEIEEAGEEQRHTRAVILLTDGEEVTGDAVAAADVLGDYAGFYVMGIGDPNGSVVEYPQWMVREVGPPPDGQKTHLSVLDEDTLIALAHEAGGVYMRTTPHNGDIERIHQEMEGLSTQAQQGELRFQMVNRFRWPLTVAVLCFGAEGLWMVLMPWLRKRRMAKGTKPLVEALKNA